MVSSIFFRCQNQNIGIFMLKITGAPLCFNQIAKKRKKSGLICFLENKYLPASSVFMKVATFTSSLKMDLIKGLIMHIMVRSNTILDYYSVQCT